MNRKGQMIFFAFMLAIVIIVFALGIAAPVKSFTDNTQALMNCTNTTISDYVRGACYITDMTPAYFIIGLIAIALAVVGAKILMGD